MLSFSLLILLSSYSILPTAALADNNDDGDDYGEFVKEVLKEDQGNHNSNEYYHEDSYYENQEEKIRLEKERIAKEEADRIKAERERAFQAELQKLNAEQQAAALKQKKLDAKIVSSILKAAEQNDLYKVLGIRNWDWKIPSRKWNIAGFKITIPGWTVKETTIKDIRKAYRIRAMSVHPDKNRDGRAQEAFIIVEETASILSNQGMREEYDSHWKTARQERRKVQIAMVTDMTDTVLGTTMKTCQTIYTLLGPFAMPVIILGALIA